MLRYGPNLSLFCALGPTLEQSPLALIPSGLALWRESRPSCHRHHETPESRVQWLGFTAAKVLAMAFGPKSSGTSPFEIYPSLPGGGSSQAGGLQDLSSRGVDG